MWIFICGAYLGGLVGMGIMCLFQINRHSEIIEKFKEEK